jgi:hypothetical protein
LALSATKADERMAAPQMMRVAARDLALVCRDLIAAKGNAMRAGEGRNRCLDRTPAAGPGVPLRIAPAAR